MREKGGPTSQPAVLDGAGGHGHPPPELSSFSGGVIFVLYSYLRFHSMSKRKVGYVQKEGDIMSKSKEMHLHFGQPYLQSAPTP